MRNDKIDESNTGIAADKRKDVMKRLMTKRLN